MEQSDQSGHPESDREEPQSQGSENGSSSDVDSEGSSDAGSNWSSNRSNDRRSSWRNSNAYPRKGKTRIPRKLVSERAIIDLGYPYIRERYVTLANVQVYDC